MSTSVVVCLVLFVVIRWAIHSGFAKWMALILSLGWVLG